MPNNTEPLLFPPYLTHLILGNRFNEIASYPSTLTHITFGSDFDQPLDSLPPSLIKIHFSFNLHGGYSQLRKLKLPPHLAHVHCTQAKCYREGSK